MSAKNLDTKGRFRNKTIAFRVSPAEKKEIDERVKLCGYQNKQDYVLDCVLHQRILAVGNPLMLTKIRQHLTLIYDELLRVNDTSELDDECLTPIKTMLEILESFKDNDMMKL